MGIFDELFASKKEYTLQDLEDSRTCFSHYLAVKIKEDKDYSKISNYFIKSFFKDKALNKIADQGAQATQDLIRGKLRNKIILFTILVDKKIKV